MMSRLLGRPGSACTPLYARARHFLLRGSRPVFWLLLRVLPARPYAVVHGWPTLEGNVVELLPSLTQRYPNRIHWLVDGDPEVAHSHVRRHDLPRVVVVPKTSLRAVWLATTAEVTFFTHGLFTAVRPPASRLVVNLWHGDGPKATDHSRDISSTVAVTGARMWQAYKARIFDLRVDDVAWTGNPRSNGLLRGMTIEQWRRLKLDPQDMLVLWMPTYRVGRNAEGLVWHDGAPLSSRSDLRQLSKLAIHPGLSLVLKPHPMDRDDYSRLGIRVLTDADLQHADVALYELLGCCSALISDTSSTWVDFLALGRPVAFFLPDADELAAKRGFNVPDLLAILPGPVLRDAYDIRDYLQTVSRNPAEPGLINLGRRARIGPAPLGDAPGRLLAWLDDYQASREQRPLFGGRPSLSGRPPRTPGSRLAVVPHPEAE